jgi:diguanylate cyclase (GGDEF)-like protein
MRKSALHTGLLAGCVGTIGTVDYLTGPEVGFSLFYLVPIVWSGWNVGRSSSVALALLASAFWFGADTAWHGVNVISVWNGFTRFGIYISMAWLTTRIRTDQQQLQVLNARLQELLAHEQHLARSDSLTGLPNRRLFVEELRRAFARSHRSRAPIAVAYLDLDRFKAFNDRSGHPAGDSVLCRIADELRRQVRGNDVAARLGGDEFALLLDQCSEDAARATAMRVMAQMTRALEEVANGQVGVSIGVACFDGPTLIPERAIDHADAAMYCAKGQGTNRVYVTRLASEYVPSGSPLNPDPARSNR